MDTSDFRKPRPDYPIVPQTAILRPRVKGFKVPKGRRGKKPRGKAVRQPPLPKPPNRYQQARTQEMKENAKDRRERLRLERDIAKETIRYREAKGEQKKVEQAVRVVEGRRVQVRNDRLIEDQARHFTALLDRSERRSGEVQAQYQEFLKQVLSQRNLEYKEPEIKFFKKAEGNLFEEEVEEEQVGGLRKAEVLQPSAPVAQSFREAGLSGGLKIELTSPLAPAAMLLQEKQRQSPTPREDVEASARRLRQREEQFGKDRELREAQQKATTSEAETERVLEEAEHTLGKLSSPTLRTAVSGLKQTISQPFVAERPPPPSPQPWGSAPLPAPQQKRVIDEGASKPRTLREGESSGEELEGRDDYDQQYRDVIAKHGMVSAEGARIAPPSAPTAPKTEGGLRRRRGLPARPEPEPQPRPEPEPEPVPVDEEQLAREFLSTARDRYGELQEGKTQTLGQIEVSDEYLSLTGAKEQPVKFSTIEKQLGDIPIQLKGQTQEFYLKIGEGFDKAGAGKQAGVYKLRNLPATAEAVGAASGTAKQRKTTMVLQSVFGSGKQGKKDVYEDIATLNPYKDVKGVNVFKQAEEEGKLRFFVKDVEGD